MLAIRATNERAIMSEAPTAINRVGAPLAPIAMARLKRMIHAVVRIADQKPILSTSWDGAVCISETFIKTLPPI
jgi:hypothetical protein